MDILLSQRKTSQDLLQRRKVNVQEKQHRPPASLPTVAISVHLLYFWHAETNRTSQAGHYADDLIVWATGVKILDMEDSINSYPEKITAYLKYNSLLISAPKSSVTLFTPDTHQAKTHPKILIEDSQLPLVQWPKILGVHLDTSLSFNKHSSHVTERVSRRNNILKALASTSWGQQKETLLMTYKAVGRLIINYAAPVWSTNLRDTNYRNIQYTQDEALRIFTGCHKTSSVDHLHAEANVLKIREQSELLSAQYSLDIWNQIMSTTPSPQGTPLRDG